MSVRENPPSAESVKAKSRAATDDDSDSTGGKKQSRGDRSKRLLDLVMLLLRARTPVTFRSIRDCFSSYQTANVEAGLRAFERDKADLLELGVPVRYITPDEDDSIDEGGYVIDLKKYLLPEVHLTTDEISALVLAASVARAVPGANYTQVVDMAVKKLAFDFPEPDTPMEFPPPPSSLTRHEPVLVHFPDSPAKSNRELSDRFAQLEAATRNRKRVSLSYRSAQSGYTRSRDVDPYGLVYRDGAWLVVGHCHLRKDLRSFRLDRILELKVAPKPKSPDFDRPQDFDARRYAARSPWTFTTNPVETVELLFHHEAASAANEDFGAQAEKQELPDGGITIRFSCGNPEYVVSRVLAAKGGIVIRAGERAKALLAEELKTIRGHYA